MSKEWNKPSKRVITKPRFDLEYFKVGDAFQVRLGENNYVNAILTAAESTKIKFSYLADGIISHKIYTCEDVMYLEPISIIKLTPDYDNGTL